MTSPTDRFTQIEATLALAALDISASEVHGTVTGAIINHLKSGITPDLLRLIVPSANSDSYANDDAVQEQYSHLNDTLYEVYRETSADLLEGNESFDLVLPDDDSALAVRVDALASWTRGFILGLLYNNAFGIDELPESGAEICRDFIQISEASSGHDDEKQEDWAFAELQEYIKVGAQLILEFVYGERASAAPDVEQ